MGGARKRPPRPLLLLDRGRPHPARQGKASLAESPHRGQPGAGGGVVALSWWSPLRHFLHRLRRRNEVEQELDAEIYAYFDILVERGMERGLTREAAERAARVRFEGPE